MKRTRHKYLTSQHHSDPTLGQNDATHPRSQIGPGGSLPPFLLWFQSKPKKPIYIVDELDVKEINSQIYAQACVKGKPIIIFMPLMNPTLY